jgi:hypothetical protein
MWTITSTEERDFNGLKLYKFKTEILHKHTICTETINAG